MRSTCLLAVLQESKHFRGTKVVPRTYVMFDRCVHFQGCIQHSSYVSVRPIQFDLYLNTVSRYNVQSNGQPVTYELLLR